MVGNARGGGCALHVCSGGVYVLFHCLVAKVGEGGNPYTGLLGGGGVFAVLWTLRSHQHSVSRQRSRSLTCVVVTGLVPPFRIGPRHNNPEVPRRTRFTFRQTINIRVTVVPVAQGARKSVADRSAAPCAEFPGAADNVRANCAPRARRRGLVRTTGTGRARVTVGGDRA